jgi:hypothetical protein
MSTYRDELEDILCNRLKEQGYQFVRGKKEPCLYICAKTGIALLHHVDDGNIAGTPEQLKKLGDTVLRKWLELKISPALTPGTKCEILKKT